MKIPFNIEGVMKTWIRENTMIKIIRNSELDFNIKEKTKIIGNNCLSYTLVSVKSYFVFSKYFFGKQL